MDPAPLRIPMRDGVSLAADLYRPRGGAPLPTLLHRTPYGRRESPAGGSLDAARLVAAGYNLVVQDVRGRFGSGGGFEPFVHEAADGADTVAWIARQPWSAPAVGMLGRSYAGAAQWLAAARAPAALRAIAPEVCASSFHEGWTYQGGAPRLRFCLLWALEDLARPTQGGPGAAAVDARLDAALAGGDALFAAPWTALALLDELAPYYRAWLEHPADDAYWRVRAARLERVAVPALVIGGWFDAFLPATLADFRALQGSAGAARLVVGPWDHLRRDGVFPGRTFPGGDVDLTALHLRWFDAHLRGRAARDADAPVRLYVTGADAWRGCDAWPPPGAAEHRLHLRAGGALAAEPAPGVTRDAFRYDPRDPVPSPAPPGGGAAWGPAAPRPGDARSDVLRYCTEPLARPLAIAGQVRVALFASSSAVETDFTAALVDVAPDGGTLALCDGIVRARRLCPGRVGRHAIEVGAAAHVFRPGHRIRLEVSSSNHPRFAANPNTGGPTLALGPAPAAVAVNTVFHGGAHPSHLSLPVVPWTE